MSLFGSFWKKGSRISRKASSVGKWQVGDKIAGRYEIYQILGGEGKSGMGIVYVCYDHEHQMPYALKTFQDKEDLLSKENRKLFEREAIVWTELDKHSNIVRAYWAERLERRLFIILEYIPPDPQMRNTLTHYLGVLIFSDIIKFSIQFCFGMEYAYSKGIEAHRDIKPDNIMVTPDKTVKITDFGLTKAFQEIQLRENIISSGESPGLSVFQTKGGKMACGTLQYMAPEQFDGYADKRSDIYSFGVTLYQMVTNGDFPFVGRNPQEYEKLHKYEKVPTFVSSIFPIIQTCLEKEPNKRYQDFASIREELQNLLLRETGEKIISPTIDETKLDAWEWENKGITLSNLGKCQEAITCYDKAIELNPGFASAQSNKGNVFSSVGRYEEAIAYYDKAIDADPGYAVAWSSKGLALMNLGRYEEAIVCYDKAIELNPRNAVAWNNKGNIFLNLGRYEEAIAYYDKAIKVDLEYAPAWSNKAGAFYAIGIYDEAVICMDKSLEFDPQNDILWANKAMALNKIAKYQEALSSVGEALRFNPNLSQAQQLKQEILQNLRR